MTTRPVFAQPGLLALVAGTGLPGGCTTFSAASVETVNPVRADGWGAGLPKLRNAVVMVLAALAAAALGLWLAA